MTEEDTFNRLCRPPVGEMLKLWRLSPIPAWSSEETPAFFKSYGWDQDAFGIAWREYNGGSIQDD